MDKKMIEAAQMYALGCISIEDVCYLLNCEECEIPSSFYSYAELYGKKYDNWLKEQELKVSK
jgi:hypothetical protein